MTVTVDTAEWKAFAAKLKAADKKLATKVRKRLRDAATPLAKEVGEEGSEAMPSGGGLAAYLKSSQKARISLTGSSVQLVLQDSGRHGVQLGKLNAGSLRHPLFGHKKHWYEQAVEAGSWDKAFDTKGDDLRRELADVLDDVAKEL